MSFINRLRPAWIASAIALLFMLPSATARAEFVGSAISMHFWSADGLGSYELSLAIPSDPWGWQLDAPLEVYGGADGGNLLATIDDLAIHLNGDPVVELSFSVTAGNSNTIISIISSTVVFAPLEGADAFATASLSITDNNGDGAFANGLISGNKVYLAQYNGGTEFANLVSTLSTPGPFSSATAEERNPVTGTVILPGAVSSIQSQYLFQLSRRDSASGTSIFQVNPAGGNIPEPSTYVLACLGAVGVWFARRRMH
jgi:hypothetical protein